jgi:hypothetical protein
MYQLKSLGNDRFQFQKSGSAPMQGTLVEIASHMINVVEIFKSDIEIALEEMSKSRHTTAEFGVLKSFMFTTSPDISQLH